MKVKKKIIYLSAYSIFIIAKILELSFFAQYVTWFFTPAYCIAILLLFIFEIVNTSNIISNTLALFFIIIVMLCVAIYVRRIEMVYLFLFIITGRHLQFDAIAKRTIYIGLIVLMMIIISSKIGIITDYIDVRSNGVSRHFVGFLYSLYAPSILLNICMLWCYIKKNRISYKSWLFFLMASVWLYFQTNARLSFYLTCVVLSYSIFVKIKPNFLIKEKKILYLTTPVFFLISTLSIAITIGYNASNQWLYKINETLGWRLLYGQRAFLKYGVRMFGQKITWLGNGLNLMGEQAAYTTESYIFVDNLYLKVLLNYGYLFLIAFLLLYTVMITLSIRKKDYMLWFMLLVLALRFTIDDLSLSVAHNTFWFLIIPSFNTFRKNRING